MPLPNCVGALVSTDVSKNGSSPQNAAWGQIYKVHNSVVYLHVGPTTL
jgi:hypothetical protein